jgi:hypothetical protein
MVKPRNEMNRKTENNCLLFVGTWGITGPIWALQPKTWIATTKVGTSYIYISM